jgi:uracil-DNA glycosylase
MFIGEGPGREEEEWGRPFIGASGSLLRKILEGLGFTDHYITNLVACRSCEPRLDENQQPMFRGGRGGKPKELWMQDTPPKPMEWGACLARLHEEIYLVDPVVIVSLGGTAAEALIGRPVTITRDHGQPREIQIPGAGFDAVLTEKKREWYHKVRGQVVAPVRQASVGYLLVPALHPAYVLRKIADKGADSPFRLLVEDVRNAIKIYEEYIKHVFQAEVSNASSTPWEEVESYYHKETDV